MNPMTRTMNLKRYLKQSPPPVLWHYTTLEGLQGIVQEEAIWATDVSQLNDSREFLHSIDLFKEVIEQRMKVLQCGTKLDSLIGTQAHSLFEDVYTLKNYQVFVSSFSISEDQLSQWRAYGATAKGVSIGFDLRRAQFIESSLTSDVFAPCIYSRSRQIDVINAWFDSYRGIVQKVFEAHGKTKGDPSKDIAEDLLDLYGPELSIELIQSMMDGGRLCALLKHESFAEEREWRLVISESRRRTIPSPHKRRIRVGATTFIPYISIPLGGSKAAHGFRSRIKKIKIGPHPEPDRAIGAMSDFLSAYNLVGTDIEASRIPFRNW